MIPIRDALSLPPDRQPFDYDVFNDALSLVTCWDAAVDGGAGQGRWARAAAIRFGKVHAFEPDPRCRAAMFAATADFSVTLYPFGLADLVDATGSDPSVRLDIYRLERVGLIRIGFQRLVVEALHGAVDTLRTNRPVVVMPADRDAIDYLGRIGAAVALRTESTVVMWWLGAKPIVRKA